MPSIHRYVLVATAAVAAANSATAQVLNFTSASPGFGTAVAIGSDYDGGGRRDLLVSVPGDGQTTSPPGSLQLLSAEGAPNTVIAQFNADNFTIPNFPPSGLPFGTVVVNIGNIDGVPGDEFAVATPRINNNPLRGEVCLFTFTRFGLTRFLQLLPVSSGNPIIGGDTFGTSMAVLPSGQLAIGEPGANRVQVFSFSANGTPSLARTLDVQTATGSIGGNLGESMATGAGNLLAVGAPLFRRPTATLFEGYVAIYDLNSNSSFPRSFLFLGNNGEELGRAVATVGPLPNGQALADFVAMGRDRLTGQGLVYLFDTPSAPSTGPTPITAMAQLRLPNTVATRGKLAALGDVDGDGVGDVAASAGGLLQVLSTRGNSLTAIAQTTHRPDGALTSGPDVAGIGAVDLVIGNPNLGPNSASVQDLPLAESIRLPNPTQLSLTPAFNSRPVQSLGSSGNYAVTVTGLSPQAIVVMIDIAPATPTVFGAGPALSYVNLANAVVLGFGTSPATFPVSLPPTLQFLYQGYVLQAGAVSATGVITPSNGIVARLGTL